MHDEQLRCFLSAARYQSFSQAARECHLTQPTVSRQIAMLEQEIGTPLFQRNGKRLLLTPAGKYLADLIQGYADQCDRLMAECRRIGVRTRTAIQVRTGPWECVLVTEPLSRFVQQTGLQGEFNCSSKSYGSLTSQLYQGSLDLAFCTAECAHRVRPDLTVTPVYRQKWLVAAAPTHAFWSLPAEKRAWLEDQTVIQGNFWLESSTVVLGRQEEVGDYEPDCFQKGLRQKEFVYGGTLYGQLAMARSGYGVTLVPPWLPDHLLQGLRTEDCLAVPYAPTIVMITNPTCGHSQLPLLTQICRDYFAELDTLK